MPVNKVSVNPGSPDPNRNKKAQQTGTVKTGTPAAPPQVPSAPLLPLARGGVVSIPLIKKAQFQGQGWNAIFTPPNFFSPIHTPQQWQIASKRREIYQWSRHWYENEPKIAAGIDFYSQFPMCGFKLECKKSHIRRAYEDLVKKLRLNYWFKYISQERILIGDVIPFLSIACPVCGGSGVDEDGEMCKHPGGTFNRITCLNPDYIEIQKSPLEDRPEIYMIPDEYLKMVVQKKIEPTYSQLSDYIKQCVMSNQPIRLSSRCASHIAHNKSPYGLYGSSLLRRMFTTLSYKTKLMTANWIVAERLVLPIRVVKVGDKDRPATAEDIADMQSNLAAVAQDPNLTIVTHHAAEFDWVGATGRIHNIQGEMELIGKEILDGFMLNQALLNGEMGHYSSAQVGVEAILHRLESWRNELADWCYEHIFEPFAKMQGFIDEEATRELQEATEDENKVVYLYPTIKWNDMNLRDNTQEVQLYMQLNQEGKVSTDTLLKKLGLNRDEEIEKIRDEQAITGPSGQMMPGGGGMGGMPGGMGGGGGGGGPPPDMGGGMGMDPTGGMGGGMDAGGAGVGGMAAGGPGISPAASGGGMRIHKRGKAPKGKEEEVAPQFGTVRFTELEAKIWRAIEQLDIAYPLYTQLKVQAPGEKQPFRMDFAFPSLKVDIEADGKVWHQKDGENRDAIRDQKLAAMGWRVLRFKEDAIKEHLDECKKIIYAQVYEAAQAAKKHKKTASANGPMQMAYLEQYGSVGRLMGVVLKPV
jgi:very-short-patch-repair endonuclease